MDESKKKIILNYAAPGLLGILIFASNFLNTSLFDFGENNFAVWFVLSLFCFAIGWFINKTLNWHYGGKIVFATIISVTLLSILLILFFGEYFSASEAIVEDLILFTLRNITLGSLAYFGMAVQEVLGDERETVILREKLKVFEDNIIDSKKESELVLQEAKLKAQKIIQDAEAEAKNTILKKERIEKELKEFIQTEKELIKKYQEL